MYPVNIKHHVTFAPVVVDTRLLPLLVKVFGE